MLLGKMSKVDGVQRSHKSFSALLWSMIFIAWVIIIIWFTTWPWSDFRGHAHWEKVSWIPFEDVTHSLSSIQDILGNCILFIPFGIFLNVFLLDPSPKIVLWGIMLASFFSATIEFYQVFCHNHFPSMTDLCANVGGACIGLNFFKPRGRSESGSDRNV